MLGGNINWPLKCDRFVLERERKESERERENCNQQPFTDVVELWGSFLCFCTSVDAAVAQSQLLRWEFPFKNVGETSLKKKKKGVNKRRMNRWPTRLFGRARSGE